LQRLQELVLRVQQGAGLDALMELDSVVSATESVDGAAAVNRLTFNCNATLRPELYYQPMCQRSVDSDGHG